MGIFRLVWRFVRWLFRAVSRWIWYTVVSKPAWPLLPSMHTGGSSLSGGA